MNKKKSLTPEEKRNKKVLRLARYYENAKSTVNLTGNVSEDVHNLVMKCVDIQKEINNVNDTIKTEDYELAKQFTDIDKQTYLEFVRICALKNNDKLHEKAIRKFELDFENRLLNTNLRYSFLNSYMSNNDDIKITDKENEEFKQFNDYISDDFNKVIESSTKKREYINLKLKLQYSIYKKAAMYITQLTLKPSEFKELVDYETYKNGGYPQLSSPSKIWSLFDKYARALRLMETYKFNQHESLNKEFGLNVSLTTPHPVHHSWMDYTDNEEE